MNRLKTLLQSNYFLYILLFLTIILSILRLIQPPRVVYSPGAKEISGVVTEIIESTDKLTLIIKGKEKIRGTYYFKSEKTLPSIKLGDYVKLTGTIKKPSSPSTKNLFDYSKYLKKQKIYHLMQIDQIKVLSTSKNIYYRIKNFLKEKITHPYKQAFLLGDDNSISDEVITSYQANGISHLFAISSSQFYFLSNIILKLTKKLNLKEKTSYTIVIIFLLSYLSILGLSASILRGILSFLLFSINRLWNLDLKKFKIITYTILITLLINPYYLTESSFYFSFLISIGLLYFMRPSTNFFKTLWTSSVLSFLLSIPISLYYFYEVNLLSIIYNLFYIPYVNIIIFPMTIISFFFPILDFLYNFFINILENSSLILSTITIGKLIFKKVNIIIYILELLFMIYYLKTHKKFILIITIIIFIGHYLSPYFNKDFIKILDVGQGDSILIHSKGKTALIDTGGKLSYDKKTSETITKYTTIPLLKSLGIKKINYLLLTHGDQDHVGEFFYLNNHFKISEVYLNLGQTSLLEEQIIKERPDTKRIKEGQNLILGNFSLFQLNKSWKEENTSSAVYYFYHSNLTGLLMGDATTQTENFLIENYNLKVDILKVGHHGSNTSTSNNFLKETSPSLAIISVGENNNYNHPSPEVLENLTNQNISYLTTIQSGTITIYPKTQILTEDKKIP